MKRSPTTRDAPLLFDLPPEQERERELLSGEPPPEAVDNLDLFPEEPAPREGAGSDGEPVVAGRAFHRRPSLLVARLQAGLVDLGVIALVLAVIVGGSALMGVRAWSEAWPALLLVAAVFSFLYFTVPLAFWGHTPGMAQSGLISRNATDDPLTFGQTFLRWVAAVATAALAGLPALLTLTGRSLGDRLSGSSTRLR